MLKVVYDTNLIVSALLYPERLPAFLLDLATQGEVKLLISRPILEEYEEVLTRPKFGFSTRRVKLLIKKLTRISKKVKPKERLSVLPDPEDEKFLECAVFGKADCLVTGNLRHYHFRIFRNVKIVSPYEFWEIYKGLLKH